MKSNSTILLVVGVVATVLVVYVVYANKQEGFQSKESIIKESLSQIDTIDKEINVLVSNIYKQTDFLRDRVKARSIHSKIYTKLTETPMPLDDYYKNNIADKFPCIDKYVLNNT